MASDLKWRKPYILPCTIMVSLEKIRKIFAKNLANLRERESLTQAAFAEALNQKYQIGLKRTSVANYEAEGIMPKIETLYCIADFFGKTIDQLLHENLERPILFLSETVKEMGPKGKNMTSMDLRPVRVEDVADWNALLQHHADAIASQQFYIVYIKSLMGAIKDKLGDLKSEEDISKIFKLTYISCLLSKSKFLRDHTEKVLEQKESDVFWGLVEKNVTIQMLAEVLRTSDDEVLKIFESARAKIEPKISPQLMSVEKIT